MIIDKITGDIFYNLIDKLKELKQDSDNISFDNLRKLLNNPTILNEDDFANEAIYVILASGFRQETAKRFFHKITEYLEKNVKANQDELMRIFANENKIKSILKIWNNRKQYRNNFYELKFDNEKLSYLKKMPYIGEITKNHLGRNLGIDIVKYDRWIIRLGIVLNGKDKSLLEKTDIKLDDEIQKACDKMFSDIKEQTKEKCGYIDVVLFKSCQQELLNIKDNKLYLNV